MLLLLLLLKLWAWGGEALPDEVLVVVIVKSQLFAASRLMEEAMPFKRPLPWP